MAPKIDGIHWQVHDDFEDFTHRKFSFVIWYVRPSVLSQKSELKRSRRKKPYRCWLESRYSIGCPFCACQSMFCFVNCRKMLQSPIFPYWKLPSFLDIFTMSLWWSSVERVVKWIAPWIDIEHPVVFPVRVNGLRTSYDVKPSCYVGEATRGD